MTRQEADEILRTTRGETIADGDKIRRLYDEVIEGIELADEYRELAKAGMDVALERDRFKSRLAAIEAAAREFQGAMRRWMLAVSKFDISPNSAGEDRGAEICAADRALAEALGEEGAREEGR